MLLPTLVLVVLLTSCQVEPATKWINSYAGPFIFSLANWNNCPGVKTERIVLFNIHVAQFRNPAIEVQKKLQIVTGNVTLAQPLTNDGVVVLRAASRSNNQWKENAYVLKFKNGICQSLMEYFPDFMRNVYKIEPNDYLKGEKPCSIPKGVYVADKVPVNWTMPNIPVLPYGILRVTVNFYWGTDARPRLIGCLKMDITIHPKLDV